MNETKINISAMDWIQMDYDVDWIDSSSFPWQRMTKREVYLLQKKYNDIIYYSVLSVADVFIRSIICLAGIIGHVFTLIVLRDKEFQTATFLLLRFVSIGDIVFCVSHWSMACLEFRSANSTSFGLMFIYTHILKNIRGAIAYFSVFVGVALACDRLAAIWYFYWYSKVGQKKKRRAVGVAVLSAFILSVIMQTGWSVSVGVGKTVNSRDEEIYHFQARVFYLDGRGQIWEKVTTLYYQVIITSFTLISSILVLWGMFKLSKRQMTTQNEKNKRNREFRTCYISFFLGACFFLWIVFDFVRKLVFNNFTFASATFEYSQTYNEALSVLSSLSLQNMIIDAGYWVWAVIHACNFYLYLALHRRFRRVFKDKMCKPQVVTPITLIPSSAVAPGAGGSQKPHTSGISIRAMFEENFVA